MCETALLNRFSHLPQQTFLAVNSFPTLNDPTGGCRNLEYCIREESRSSTASGSRISRSESRSPSRSPSGKDPNSDSLNEPPRRSSQTSSPRQRAAHNELEKTRRANLRGSLEKLNELLPACGENVRSTTLMLLTRARDHVQMIDSRSCEETERNEKLRARIDELQKLLEEARNIKQSRELRRKIARRPTRNSDEENIIFMDDSTICESKSTSSKQNVWNLPQASNVMHMPNMIDPDLHGLRPLRPLPNPRPSRYPYLDVHQHFRQDDV